MQAMLLFSCGYVSVSTMNESLNSWSEIVNILPVIITIVPFLFWAIAFRSAYTSKSEHRAVWLVVLGVSLVIFPIFGAIIYFAFRNSPILANLPKGRTIGELMNSAQQMQDRKTGNSSTPDSNPDVTLNEVTNVQAPAPHDPNDFSTHVPPLPDKPSDKYEVLK